MKVIMCDQCSKIIKEEVNFFLCTCNLVELIEGEVCSTYPVIVGEESHFCTIGCVIDKLTQEWKEHNESH